MNLRKQATLTSVLMITTFLAGSASAIGAPFTEIDANGDNQLTKEELTATFGADRAATALEKLDTDKNGTVSWEEAAAAEEVTEVDGEIDLDDVDLDGNNQVTWEELTDQFGEEEAAEILAILDGDADGTITEDEFVGAILAALSDEDFDDEDFINLDDADANGDGDLTKKELAAKFGEDEAKELLADLDLNKDGTITDAEFEKVVMASMEDEAADEELDLYAVDLDADGNITREELEAFVGDDAEIALEHLDEDMDGVISMAELDKVYAAHDTDMADGDDDTINADAENDLDLSGEELALAVSQAIVNTLTEELERLSNETDTDNAQDDSDSDDMDWDDDDSWEDDDIDVDDLF